MTSTQIKLYTLVPEVGKQSPIWSPHVWKTLLDLKYLGIPFTTTGYTFVQIREELAKATGNQKITVPTIQLESGEYVTESFIIAEYLEKNYAKDKSLFGSSAGKNLAKFIESWATNIFAPETRPLIIPSVIERIDTPSQNYFISQKLGSVQKHESLISLNANSETVNSKIEIIKKNLKIIDNILRDGYVSGEGRYLHGKQPGHADFVLFGEYAFARTSPVYFKGVWESPDLPGVTAWVGEILGSGLVDLELLV